MASVLAVDSGKQADHAALALCVEDAPAHGGLVRVPRLERIPLGTTYRWLVGHVARCLTQHAAMRPVLVLGRSGVGVAIQEAAKEAGLHPLGIATTAGHTVYYHPSWPGLSVPKHRLVAALSRLVRPGRLRLGDGVSRDVRAALVMEMRHFTMTVTARGHACYGARTAAAHDDLLSALSLGAFYLAERADVLAQPGRRGA